MHKTLIKSALLCSLINIACPALADDIQVMPPTPIGSMVACPVGAQEILSYSGAPLSTGQAGTNCVPIYTDAAGDLAASGYVQIGNSSFACNAALAGAMRFNPATHAFEGCNGTGWQSIGASSGNGKLYWDGNWGGDHYWCDSGYHVVAFHYDCGCSNNATWFECQPN